jgi:hypothetical protein
MRAKPIAPRGGREARPIPVRNPSDSRPIPVRLVGRCLWQPCRRAGGLFVLVKRSAPLLSRARFARNHAGEQGRYAQGCALRAARSAALRARLALPPVGTALRAVI